jgi:hypothetical protein
LQLWEYAPVHFIPSINATSGGIAVAHSLSIDEFWNDPIAENFLDMPLKDSNAYMQRDAVKPIGRMLHLTTMNVP